MTDAHCHVSRGETRHFLCAPFAGNPGKNDTVFYGCHPWQFLKTSVPDGPEPLDDLSFLDDLEAQLAGDPKAGVGEIGLDRLKDREISPLMRAAFVAQLRLAAKYRRPVVLHGAKCWGDVVATIRKTFPPQHQPSTSTSTSTSNLHLKLPPAFLFHGFSRAGGLLPDIVALNGFVSVGPAVLNDHAVNYRRLVCGIPLGRLLVESDAAAQNADEAPSVVLIAAKVAELRGLSPAALEAQLEANAHRFLTYLDF